MTTWYSDANPHELCITNEKEETQFQKIEGTSNENEYRAVIWAIEQMNSGDKLLSDSQLVVNQSTKGWKVRAPNLKQLNIKVKKLLKEKNIVLEWTPRENNSAGHLI
jgi:ribonuclease HI